MASQEMATFEFEIVRPTSSKTMVVEHIVVQAVSGNFVVGPDHSPLIAVLRPKGDLLFKEAGKGEQKIDTFGGLFVIQDGKATCVLES
jgi:F0F1-type ATP synthase epsilon subunit